MKIAVIKNLLRYPIVFNKSGVLAAIFILYALLCIYSDVVQNTENMIHFKTGIIFMLYVLTQTNRWWAIFLLQMMLSFFLKLDVSMPLAFIETFADLVNALVSATLFKALFKIKIAEPHLRSFVIVTLSAAIGSFLGALIYHYGIMYFIPNIFHHYNIIIRTLSAVIGIIIISPVVIWRQHIGLPDIIRTTRKMLPELSLLIVSTILVTFLIFTHTLNTINLAITFPYLILPFILWAAIRFHPFILTILIVAESLIILRYQQTGVFFLPQGKQPFHLEIISIQIFILFTLEFSYVMSGLIISRNEAQLKIKKLNEDLEQRVATRTTELQQAVEALLQSEEQFREAFDTAMHGMALIALDGSFLRVNTALCDMIGYQKNQLLASNLRKISYREDYLHETKKLKKLASGNIFNYQMEKRLIHREKLEVWVLESNSLITNASGAPSHFVSQVVNITERKQSENQLRKYSETLTVLLREVNHRVKNNLSALISILHIEEDKAEASGKTNYIGILKNLTGRIEGLSTVHSMLSAANWHPLEIKQLCEQVILAVIRGLPSDSLIKLEVNCVELKINSNQAHHLAMILNELATNTVKYGITDNKEGLITIDVKEWDGKFHLVYKDNGPGFPEPVLQGDPSMISTGFELIRGIITQSLDGEYTIKNEEGASVEILFPNELF